MYGMHEINIGGFHCVQIRNVLINTVPEKFTEELLSKVNPQVITHIILTSGTPDRCGAVGAFIKINPDIKIVASIGTVKNTREILNTDFTHITVKNNMELLGFSFFLTPDKPWPDSISVFDTQSRCLFTEDEGRLYDEWIELVRQLDPEKCISYKNGVFSLTAYYSAPENKEDYIAVIYSSYYGFTQEMAETAAECIGDKFSVKLVSCSDDNAVRVLENSRAALIGTYTENRAIPPDMRNVLINADPNKISKKPCAVFGSYGWSGEAMAQTYAVLRAFRADVFEKPFRSPLKMSDVKKTEFIDFTKRFINEV